MSGPELCPKCKGLHFKTAPCIVRKSKLIMAVDHGRDDGKATVIGKVGNDGAMEIVSIVHSPPKRHRGRPKTITDMRAYKADWQRKYRADKKAGLR